MKPALFQCSGKYCIRPACCFFADREDEKLCYFHAACHAKLDDKHKLTFVDASLGNRQAREFKQIAYQVWDDIADGLEAESKKRRKRDKELKRPITTTTTTSSSSSISDSLNNVNNKRERPSHVLLTAARLPQMQEEESNDARAYSEHVECEACGLVGKVTVTHLTSSISAGKSDTWGSSSRPDQVAKHTCHACNYTWTVAE